MKINFTQILQDSWHFFRNRQKIMLQLALILFAVQVMSALLNPFSIQQDSLNNSNVIEVMKNNTLSVVFFISITQLTTTLINAWSLMTIHQISRQTDRTLGQNFRAIYPRFVGMAVLNLLIILPIASSLATILGAFLRQDSASMVWLFVLLLGFWLFIRLNLAPLHYLVSQEPLGASLRRVWQQGRNQKGALVIYTLLVYFVTPVLVLQLSALFDSLVFSLIMSVFAAVLNIFMLVVTYRFYSLFMQEA